MTNPNVRLLEIVPGLVLRFEIQPTGIVQVQSIPKQREQVRFLLLNSYHSEAIESLFPNGYQEPPKLTDPEPEKVEWKEVKDES